MHSVGASSPVMTTLRNSQQEDSLPQFRADLSRCYHEGRHVATATMAPTLPMWKTHEERGARSAAHDLAALWVQ